MYIPKVHELSMLIRRTAKPPSSTVKSYQYPCLALKEIDLQLLPTTIININHCFD